MKIRLQAGKLDYTENEAAHALGISTGQFRSLLLRHLLQRQMLTRVRLTRFRPTDLLLLSVLEQKHNR